MLFRSGTDGVHRGGPSGRGPEPQPLTALPLINQASLTVLPLINHAWRVEISSPCLGWDAMVTSPPVCSAAVLEKPMNHTHTLTHSHTHSKMAIVILE